MDTIRIRTTPTASAACFQVFSRLITEVLDGKVSGLSIVLHPDEVHDGRAGTDAGFHYRMLYVEPRLIRDALGTQAPALPFIQGGVSDDRKLSQSVAAALGISLAHLSRWRSIR